jgi:ring-1,2-phenylacetyl-CoA epoxidase subunit PaaA
MAVQLRSEEDTRRHLAAGKLVEGLEHMSPTYLEGMRRILTVSADTELISAPAYFRAAQDAPSLNAFGSAISIVQDELAHAHIAYRLLEDLGADKDWLIYERPAGQWKYPYAFDVPLDSWSELVVANAFYDQAGYNLLSDIYQSTTFGPWKRALAKVDKEESFHLRHGQQWIRRLVQDPQEKAKLQRAVDWMFLLTVEWFGLPDEQKLHNEQLQYGFKGQSNDQLRQRWMSIVVPFCSEVGLNTQAHFDDQQNKYVIDVPFPAHFDAPNKRWLLEDGPIGWDEVLKRWKARGPMNEEYVAVLQRGARGGPEPRVPSPERREHERT